MSNQYGMKQSRKPLKGQMVSSNYGSFETLVVSNLQLENINIAGLFQDGVFENVIIRDSEISNTVIGVDSPNVGSFTNLKAYQNVNFLSNTFDSYVSWDPSTSTFTINNGEFRVNGCSYLDNIEVCRNDIMAINPNGSINMYPEGVGSLNLYGPVNINSTFGNFYTKVSDGGATFNIKDNFFINSSKGSSSISTFGKHTYNTINGDIELRTETCDPVNISLINVTSSSMQITTFEPHNLLLGDSIKFTDNFEGIFVVNYISSDNSFSLNYSSLLISTSTDITNGSFIKVPSNNIILNTKSFVQIPSDTKVSFGTTSNAISGNTGSLLVKSLGNTVFNVPSLQIPEFTPIQFTSNITTGSGFLTTGNKILYDGTDMNFIGNNKLLFSSNLTQINSTNTRFYDPVLTIGDYTLQTLDLKDRGIEYRYLNSSGSMKTGWFGYKMSSNKFTFIPDSTNTNETISGTPGEFEIGNISANNITIQSSGIFDLNCGQLINTNKIIGCGGYLNVVASNAFNLTSGSINIGASNSINIPNNIPINIGTNGSFIIETTGGNINVSSLKNICIFTQRKGSIHIPIETKISFDGSNSQSIYSNTFGNLYIDGNKSIYLTTTSGNIILPPNVFGATSSSLQFGNDSEVIYGNTTGIYIFSRNSINETSLVNINQNAGGNFNQTISGNVNEIANGNVNITSILGNISLQSNNGDITLFSTNGNIRLLAGSRIVFGISDTSNSIRSDTVGNLVINGNNSNIIDIKNANTINLNASSNIRISTGTTVFFSSDNSRYIVSESSGNFNITNNIGTTTLDSLNTILNNTSGSLSIKNISTNISSNSLTVSGDTVFLNTQHVKIRDPILTLANYNLVSNDLLDRGIEYNFYPTIGSLQSGWFGRKNNTNLFTYYKNSINNNEIVSGTLGSAQFDSLFLQNEITFSGTGPGNINMNCGTIANLNTILGCNGTVNISTNNIVLSGTSKVLLPYNTPLSFGNTNNSISSDSNGSFVITAMGGSGTVILNSNVQINGTTSNIYSTVTNIQDPIFSIGGVSGPLLNDAKDRGIEFKWNHDNTVSGSKTGFFGFKNSLQRFVFIRDGTNLNEVYTGSYGNVQFGNALLTHIDLQNGTISNLNTISSNMLIINSNDSITLRSNNINIPQNSFLNFGSSSNGNSISTNTLGNLDIITSSGNVNFLLNQNSSINFPQNIPLNFGNVSSGNYIISNTNGSFVINNSSGNINLVPTVSSGSVNIPTYNYLNFGSGSTRNSLYSDGQQLFINGYSGININSTSFNIGGNVNITGTITAAVNADFDLNRYILPLGTSQILNIASVENYNTTTNTNGNFIKITTTTPTYYTVGDSVTVTNTGSFPSVDGTYNVSGILSSTSFFINNIRGTPLTTTSGSIGTVKSNLMTYQGKDVGIQVNYWNGIGITSGSSGYKTGFFGFKNNTNRWSFYNNATITDNIVTGTLSDIQVNTVYTTFMSGFGLQGPVSAGSNQISGNNFQVLGGSINGTPIGANTAQSARFSTLSNTVSASLQNVTLTSSLAYTFERYTLSSSGLNSRNPSVSTVVSLFSVSGPSYTTSSGTMPSNSANIPDGTFKILVCSSLGIGSSHTVFFGTNKLIAPNPLDSNSVPTRIIFKRQGQTAKLLFDAQGNGGLGCWILLTSGAYVS